MALRDAKMTDPATVAAFLDATKIDALAVTIGNVHGKYAVNPPVLDWARLDAVRAEAGETPLVLHGASGLPDAMIAQVAHACYVIVARPTPWLCRHARARAASASCRDSW